MELYKKVKGSDRHSDGDLLMTIQSFGETLYSGRAREIKITEEDIHEHVEDMVLDYLTEEENNLYINGRIEGAKWLLSKFKG